MGFAQGVEKYGGECSVLGEWGRVRECEEEAGHRSTKHKKTPDTKMAPDRGGDTDAILVAGVGFEPTTFGL